jgi:hypothetical protein
MVRPNSLESGFPGKRDEPIRAGITAIVFIGWFIHIWRLSAMDVRSIQLMAII